MEIKLMEKIKENVSTVELDDSVDYVVTTNQIKESNLLLFIKMITIIKDVKYV